MARDNSVEINLESLLRLSSKLNESRDEKFILNSALLSLMGKLRIFKACAMTPRDGAFVPTVIKGGFRCDAPLKIEVDAIRPVELTNERRLAAHGFGYVVPLKSADASLAVLLLGNKISGDTFEKSELQYIELVSDIAAKALENARNHRELTESKNSLEKRNLLLTSMFEMSRDFSSLLSGDQILKMLSFHLMGRLTVSKFSIFIFNEDNSFDTIADKLGVSPGLTEVESLKRTENVSNIFDSDLSEDFKEKLFGLGASAIAPMTLQGKSRGATIVGSKLTGEEINEDDLQFLKAVCSTAISAFENERMFQRELESRRLQSELDLALSIQQKLMPKRPPVVPGWDVSGFSLPSRNVGGDYYDIVRNSEGELMLAIADVSGKGMPAALLMANIQAAFRTLAPLGIEPPDLVDRINKIVYQNTGSDKFVTFFYGALDIGNSTFRYVNAGHNPPFVFRASGEVEELREGGLILGVMEEPPLYGEETIYLNPGDLILMFTDGANEAQNSQREEFGEKRIIETVKSSIDKSCSEILDDLTKAVVEHSSTPRLADDLTMVAARRV